ncbi:MAG: single-stranded DNA-binding protein, partial [Acidimicrobiia bacterium]|nr:single-stranded DNA-binding protein [Acidimicrobiia bacterium]
MPENTVTIVGNLTQDPEMRFTPNGVAMARLSIAVNRRSFNRETNQWEEGETSYFNATCWRQMAENVSESLRKGTRVVVTGRLQQRSWETSEGEKRYMVEIQVDEVAPSLRFATASVTRIPRGGSWGGGGEQSSV